MIQLGNQIEDRLGLLHQNTGGFHIAGSIQRKAEDGGCDGGDGLEQDTGGGKDHALFTHMILPLGPFHNIGHHGEDE